MGAAFLNNFIHFLVIGLQLLILGRVLLSWLDPMGRSAFAPFVVGVTEPILAPVRRLLPKTGVFDVSPLIVLLVLGFIVRAVP